MLQQVNPNGYTEHSKLAHILVSFSQYVQNYQFTPTYPSRPTGLYATYVSFRYTHTHHAHTANTPLVRHVQTPTSCTDTHSYGLQRHSPVGPVQSPTRTALTDIQSYDKYYRHPSVLPLHPPPTCTGTLPYGL